MTLISNTLRPTKVAVFSDQHGFDRSEHASRHFARSVSSFSMFLILLSVALAPQSMTGALTAPLHPSHSRIPRRSSPGLRSPSRSSSALFSHSDDGGAGAGAQPSSAVPARKAKHQSRKKLQKNRKKRAAHSKSKAKGPLSERDVGHHVASQYVKGSGGLLHHTAARRRRMEDASRLFRTDPSHKNHVDYLKKLDGHPALVLNADYQPLSMLPISLWSWQDAVKAVFSGKVTVVDVYPDVNIRAVNLDVPLPSVIALNEYAPRVNQKPAFTRRNVFLRDSYRCQYCAEYYRTSDLSLDHYVPRCHGGKLAWDNTVTCCRKCNGRKGSRLPGELGAIGMRVLREPRVPTKWELAAEAGKMLPRKVHPTWAPYLGFGAEGSPPPSSSSSKRAKGGATDADVGVKAIFEDVDV